MTTLRNAISELASSFASSVLEAIRGMSLEDIIDESNGVRRGPGRPRAAMTPSADARTSPAGRRGATRRSERLERRSQADIAAIVDRIVELLEKHPEGLRAEQIREKLGLEAKELPRPIADALSQRRITKSGQKRATTYFARSASAGGRASGRGGAKAAGKRASSGRKAGKKGGKVGRKGKRARPAKAAAPEAQETPTSSEE